LVWLGALISGSDVAWLLNTVDNRCYFSSLVHIACFVVRERVIGGMKDMQTKDAPRQRGA